MADLDSSLTDARKRHAAAVTAQASASDGEVRARDAALAASALLADLRSQEHEIETLARMVVEMGRHKQVLVDSTERLAEHEKALAALDSAKQGHDQAVADQQQAERAFEEKSAAFAAAQRDALERQGLIGRRDKLKIELDGAHAHLSATEALEKAQAEYDAAAAAALDAQTRHHHAGEEEVARESDYISAQASVLAERLEDGVPCPVCGGSDHPQPAHGTGDAGLLEKAWRGAQTASIAAAKIDREAQSRASSAKATLDARQATVSDLVVPQRGISEVDTEYQHALAAINKLGGIADVTLLAKEVGELRDRKLTTATKLQQASSTLGDATTAEALSRQGYADRIASVPETLRDSNVLQAAIEAARVDLDRRKNAIADALEQQQSSQAARIKAEAVLQNASASLNDCADGVERKQAEFESRLIELGISEAVYRSAIPDIDLIGELEGSIVEFDNSLAAARGRQTAARNAVGSAQRPAMEPFRLSCNQAQAAADDASRHSAEAQQKHRSLLDLQTSLADECTHPIGTALFCL